ncbi:Tripartite DNA replication factor [Thoreauomyces humboldtii]|nr:Tripartite DNA replication factor [Thoreauomyces humboldtii]
MEDFIFADLLSAQEAAPSTAAPSLITPRSMARDPGVASRQKPTHLNGHPLSPISAGSHDEASHDESAPVVQNKDTKRRKLSAEEKEARARDRAIRNRQAAQDSRDKKRKYIDDLEASNTELANHNKQLVERLQSTEQTNMTLASRLEQMATQLATFRKRFKTTNTPSGITDMTDTLTLGALSSDPAAVRRRTSQHVTSIQHGSTSSENGAPVSYVTPLLTEMSTTKRSSLSVSNPNAGTSHPPSPSTSRTISTSPQAHPLATLVVTTLFNSLVFLTSGARAASGLASVLTLGSESTRPVDGVDANTAPFHTVKNRTSSGAIARELASATKSGTDIRRFLGTSAAAKDGTSPAPVVQGKPVDENNGPVLGRGKSKRVPLIKAGASTDAQASAAGVNVTPARRSALGDANLTDAALKSRDRVSDAAGGSGAQTWNFIALDNFLRKIEKLKKEKREHHFWNKENLAPGERVVNARRKKSLPEDLAPEPERATAKAAIAEPPRKKSAIKPRKRYSRFLVLEVSRKEYGLAGRSPEKILRLLDESASRERYLHLREDWYHTEVSVGDYLNVHGEFEMSLNRCIADNKQTIVVLHPDSLVSATGLSESFQCLRMSILKDRVGSESQMTPPIVYGNLLHSLMQTCLAEEDFSTDRIKRGIGELVKDNVKDLYAIAETETAAIIFMSQFAPVLEGWAKRFVSKGKAPKPDGTVHTARAENGKETTICVSKILDIEEHVWSPMFGVKGNIDATLQVKIREGFGRPRTLVAPFEIKTGKGGANNGIIAHRAQTTLYALLMSDRYDVDVASGLLYYLRAGDMLLVPSSRDDVRGLMIARNSMAGYINDRTKLPPMIRQLSTCQRCYSLDTCLVYHKAVESGTADTSALGSLFDKKTGHMTPSHTAFFDKWERLITMEEGDLHRLRKELWTLQGPEREKLRRCFSGLTVLPDPANEGPSGSGKLRYRYRMARAAFEPVDGEAPAAPISFMSSSITIGDPIVISTEAGHYALAIGFITDIQPAMITVAVDRQLHGAPNRHPDFDPVNNQDFRGILDAAPKEHGDSNDLPLYRVDKDELAAGMGLARRNLVTLLSENGDAKRRKLIIDLEAPTFQHDPGRTSATVTDPPATTSLNDDQLKALNKVLGANDYTLILGMPGTGKTSTIAELIRMLVHRGKSVLLTSYTHSAVDNVLLKLHDSKVDFLRLGNPEKIHAAIRQYTVALANITSVTELTNFYASKNVVATTCLGINDIVFSKRRFDYCIVDEASQVTLPVCLGPLRYADVFVLVGDHYQLPPLIRNPEAREAGFNASLFKILTEAHPEAVVNLQQQYRMNADIMMLSNTLIYNHRLRCGSPDVAHSKLSVPNLVAGLSAVHTFRTKKGDGPSLCEKQSSCFDKRSLTLPTQQLKFKGSRRVVFVNTDDVPALDTRPGDLVQNDIEALLLHQTVETLVACGVQESAIGVISPYRSQLKIINQLLKHRPSIDVLTVDKFQGSDKECVVISLVRSNKNGNVGHLLKDWSRINVALTRAKEKLIIFGSKSTLREAPVFARSLEVIDSKGWELRLPPGAQNFHEFEQPVGKEIGTRPGLPSTPDLARVKTGQARPRTLARVIARHHPVAEDIMNDLGL